MSENKSTNITWHNGSISKEDRTRLSGHKGVCLWYTGLSASGKSTIAMKVEEKLFEKGMRTFVLDGDNIRHGLNKNLGFSPEDRVENIRRIGEVSKLFVEAGTIVSTAFISPYREDRDNVRKLYEKGEFVEIYIKAELETCEERDPKGLYKKALAGEIKEFTGISAPYEEPLNPELIVNTTEEIDIDKNADKVINYLTLNGYILSREEAATGTNA
ncbi:MAG TPA: adenylyl-sulfate kinase [Ignavibacteriaceae bacterium]|nr:adenylyl-sulfate kinase [Ignavibacteriaceae bacterium]